MHRARMPSLVCPEHAHLTLPACPEQHGATQGASEGGRERRRDAGSRTPSPAAGGPRPLPAPSKRQFGSPHSQHASAASPHVQPDTGTARGLDSTESLTHVQTDAGTAGAEGYGRPRSTHTPDRSPARKTGFGIPSGSVISMGIHRKPIGNRFCDLYGNI